MNIRTSRQWLVTHEWMVKPTRQTDWIDGRGLLVWLAEVFSALGTGLYLVSLFVGSWWGALAGWALIVVFKLPLHLLYLGKPLRFWRAIPPFTKAWRTSWLARGMFFTIVFTLFGAIQLVTTYLLRHDVLAASAVSSINVLDWVVKILAGLFAVLTGIYAGFAMSYCKSIPFWNTGLLPIVFVIMAVADGMALVMGIGLVGSGIDINAIEAASRVALIINALLIMTYLVNASYQSTTAGLSVRELVVGRVAVAFWPGVVLSGIAIPLGISLASLFVGEASRPLLVIAIVFHTVGAFALKYCVLKVGICRPLLPKLYAH
jgi:formate-dependent nitrite reductase membrane component NrfD